MLDVTTVAVSAMALLACAGLLWRARASCGFARTFWLLSAAAAAAAAVDGTAGHVLLACSVGALVAMRGRVAGSVVGIDAACLTFAAAPAALAALPTAPGSPSVQVFTAVTLLSAAAGLAAVPGVRDASLWTLLAGLGVLAASDVVGIAAPPIDIPSGALAGARAAGYGTLAVAALLPGAAVVAEARPARHRQLQMRNLVPLWLALGILPCSYLLMQPGSRDALAYAVASAAAGALVVTRVAVVGRAHDAEHAAHEESAKRFRALVEHGSDVVCVVDEAGAITYVSPSVLSVFGHRPDKVAAAGWRDAVHLSDVRSILETCAQVRGGAGRQARVEARIRGGGGAWRWVDVTITNRLHDKAVQGLVCNLRDIEAHKRAQEELRNQARHDALTGLPNRTFLLERLHTVIARGGRDSVAVAFLDLDHFKEINDSLGHEVGDLLLTIVAQRIREAVRPGDVVARFGGDEFVVVCEQLTSRRDAIAIVDRLLERMRVPIDAGGHELHVTPSVGIAFSTGDGDSPDTLIRDADAAMYHAKADGRARHAVFNRGMREQAIQRLETGTGLHAALKRDEFRVFYQPIVEVVTGAVVSVEALVRWQHPRHGLLGPGHFIDLAEERGLTSSIGERVLAIATADMGRWDRRVGAAPLELAVNISARQLQNPTFVRDVERALVESGFNPARLCLEITENVLLEYADAVVDTLKRLKTLGVRIGIDDFGAGYTSLSYLKRFPVDVMKIDQSFVAGICDHAQDAAIVSAVIDLAHTFETTTVAEGVETPAQLARLAEMGCDLAQGFLFARPRPSHLVDELLARRTSTETLRTS